MNESFYSLQAELSWVQGEITLFGRSIDEPRLTAWCGDVSYTYSRRVLEKRPWHPLLNRLRNAIEARLRTDGVSTPHGLNHCFLIIIELITTRWGGTVIMSRSLVDTQ